MTTLHKAAQMALDALDAITDDVDGTGLNTMPSFDKALDAIAALREALNAPEPEPVAEVYRARYGRRARYIGVDDVRKLDGVALPPLGTKLYAATPAAPEPSVDDMPGMWEPSDTFGGEADSAAPPAAPDHLRDIAEKVAPAAPVPDGWVMVPREPTPEMLAVVRNGPMHETWTEGYCAMIAASPAAPAAPVVPLTDEQRQRIHNETGAGHSPICLVESYINAITGASK